MAVSFPTNDALDMAAGGAALVANLIVPGSGVVVGKVVKAGGAIVAGLVNLFKKKKAEGKTDADAIRETAAAATPQDIAEMEQLAENRGQWATMLGDLTPDDKKVSALLKDQKMKGEAGKYTLLELYKQAVSSGYINPNGLRVYRGIENPEEAYSMNSGINSLVDSLAGGGGSVNGSGVGASGLGGSAGQSGSGNGTPPPPPSGAVPGQSSGTSSKGSSSPIILILLSVVAFFMALPYFFMKPYRRYKRKTSYNTYKRRSGYRPNYNSSTTKNRK
jgi:hypothetical protein